MAVAGVPIVPTTPPVKTVAAALKLVGAEIAYPVASRPRRGRRTRPALPPLR